MARSAFAAQLASPHAGGAGQAQGVRPRHACGFCGRRIARCSPICANMRARQSSALPMSSRTAQAVELDLSEFAGRVPVELSGGAVFPMIGQLTYLLTLPPYGFYWFRWRAMWRRRPGVRPRSGPVIEHHTFVLRHGLAEIAEEGRAPCWSKRCCRHISASAAGSAEGRDKPGPLEIDFAGHDPKAAGESCLYTEIAVHGSGARTATMPCRLPSPGRTRHKSVRSAAGARPGAHADRAWVC